MTLYLKEFKYICLKSPLTNFKYNWNENDFQTTSIYVKIIFTFQLLAFSFHTILRTLIQSEYNVQFSKIHWNFWNWECVAMVEDAGKVEHVKMEMFDGECLCRNGFLMRY